MGARTYVCLGCMVLGLSGCAPIRPPLLLDGQPWPRDANGKYLEGSARVLVELDYHGKVVGDCIDKSSGQPALDALALRKAEFLPYSPALYRGWPMPSYARLPVSFHIDSSQPAASATPQQVQDRPACKVIPLPGRDASAVDRELTIRPSAHATLPSSQPAVAWPKAQDGHPAQADVNVMVLVDYRGSILDALIGGRGDYEPLDRDAYRRAFGMHVTPTGEQHWEFLHVHYRADGGSAITQGRQGRSPGLPPVPRGGIRIFRDSHGDFPNGGAWPRARSGLYLRATVVVEAFVNTEGRVVNVRLKHGTGMASFDERALRELRRRQFPAPLQAYWKTVPVDFLPVEDPGRKAIGYTPPARF